MPAKTPLLSLIYNRAQRRLCEENREIYRLFLKEETANLVPGEKRDVIYSRSKARIKRKFPERFAEIYKEEAAKEGLDRELNVPPPDDVTELLRGAIIALANRGNSIKEIARVLDKSVQDVAEFMERINDTL